jgi:hypothetical protein
MNRRNILLFAASGLGLAAIPGTLARATSSLAPALPPPPAPLPLSGAAMSTRAILLDRAKAALDRHRNAFQLRDRVALADFSIASRELRFHIVDLMAGQVSSYLVAHGRGSDPEHSGWLHRFSNEPGSLATSNGAYRTGEIYDGVHGAAMRLIGLEPVNNNAEPRAIVIHGADYVSEDHIATWGKLGRSEGCFVFARHMIPQVLGLLGPGRLLYADRVTA